jgi:hypothetical protein
MFEYTSGGGIGLGGCGGRRVTLYRHFRFGPGDTVYLCYRAIRGVLERVTIKRINIVQNERTAGQIIPLYVDTYNSIYNEDDLCTEAQAIAKANYFYNKQLVEIDELLKNCRLY